MQNKVSRIGEDCYVYDSIFAGIRDLFIQADYVCGSLETPLAGKELGYSESAINFNTPDSFAEALKKVGIKQSLFGQGNNRTQKNNKGLG